MAERRISSWRKLSMVRPWAKLATAKAASCMSNRSFFDSGCKKCDPVSICNFKEVWIDGGTDAYKFHPVAEKLSQVFLQSKPLIRNGWGGIVGKFDKKIQITGRGVKIATGRRPEQLKPPHMMLVA